MRRFAESRRNIGFRRHDAGATDAGNDTRRRDAMQMPHGATILHWDAVDTRRRRRVVFAGTTAENDANTA